MLRTTLRTTFTFALASVTLVACGDTTSGTNVMAQPDLAMPPPPDMTFDPGPYPTANVGTQEGKVLYNIKAMGYMLSREQQDVSQLKYEEVRLEVIRNDPRCKCLMLSEAATWCGPCNAEMPELIKAVEEDSSFCVFNVLIDGPMRGVRATQSDVEEWATRHAQNFPVVGANATTYVRLPRPDALPTNVVVNPRTMEILAINAGLGPKTIPDAKELCAASQ